MHISCCRRCPIKLGSCYLRARSSVPQGSILGPILFAVFINDLPEAISNGSSEAMYADDTKLTSCLETSTLRLTVIVYKNPYQTSTRGAMIITSS